MCAKMSKFFTIIQILKLFEILENKLGAAIKRMRHEVKFKPKATSLNSVFSFSLTGFRIKDKTSSLRNIIYLQRGGR